LTEVPAWPCRPTGWKRTFTRRSAWPRTRTARRSDAPTGTWPASYIPTPIPTTWPRQSEFRRAVAGRAGAGARGGEAGGWGQDNGGRWTRFGGGFGPGDDQDAAAWTTFDTSTWSTIDPDDLEDLFGSVLGGTSRRTNAPRRGADLEAELHLEFDDAVHGLTTGVTLNGVEGSRTFKVRVPAGVDDGQRIRLPGKGGPGANGGPSGDLYAVVRVAPHPTFRRHGQDLTVDASIGWPEAVLGTEIQVPTLDGRSVRVRVPAGTPSGRTLRVRGHGVRTAKATGDLLVSIRLTVPEELTDEQRAAVEAVAEAFAPTAAASTAA
jgi:molecular chaperone DnaJ